MATKNTNSLFVFESLVMEAVYNHTSIEVKLDVAPFYTTTVVDGKIKL